MDRFLFDSLGETKDYKVLSSLVHDNALKFYF